MPVQVMNADSVLDQVLFKLTTTRTRCEVLAIAGGKEEKLMSGFVRPFVVHFKAAEEQVAQGAYIIRLEPGRIYRSSYIYGTSKSGNGRKVAYSWFTKGTVQRVIRFVQLPELLERVITIDVELLQIEDSLRAEELYFDSYRGHDGEDEPMSDEYARTVSASSLSIDAVHSAVSRTHSPQHNGRPDSPPRIMRSNSAGRLASPRGELIRGFGEYTGDLARRRRKSLDIRRSMLRREQGVAFARATAAGFILENIPSLVAFAECFGAQRLREACSKFLALVRRRDLAHNDEIIGIGGQGTFSVMRQGVYSDDTDFADVRSVRSDSGIEALSAYAESEGSSVSDRDVVLKPRSSSMGNPPSKSDLMALDERPSTSGPSTSTEDSSACETPPVRIFRSRRDQDVTSRPSSGNLSYGREPVIRASITGLGPRKVQHHQYMVEAQPILPTNGAFIAEPEVNMTDQITPIEETVVQTTGRQGRESRHSLGAEVLMHGVVAEIEAPRGSQEQLVEVPAFVHVVEEEDIYIGIKENDWGKKRQREQRDSLGEADLRGLALDVSPPLDDPCDGQVFNFEQELTGEIRFSSATCQEHRQLLGEEDFLGNMTLGEGKKVDEPAPIVPASMNDNLMAWSSQEAATAINIDLGEAELRGEYALDVNGHKNVENTVHADDFTTQLVNDVGNGQDVRTMLDEMDLGSLVPIIQKRVSESDMDPSVAIPEEDFTASNGVAGTKLSLDNELLMEEEVHMQKDKVIERKRPSTSSLLRKGKSDAGGKANTDLIVTEAQLRARERLRARQLEEKRRKEEEKQKLEDAKAQKLARIASKLNYLGSGVSRLTSPSKVPSSLTAMVEKGKNALATPLTPEKAKPGLDSLSRLTSPTQASLAASRLAEKGRGSPGKSPNGSHTVGSGASISKGRRPFY